MFQTRALICGDDVSNVLDRAGTINHCPPGHRLGRAPRIHVGRNAYQNLSAIRRELAYRFGKQPVVTNRTTNAADWRGRNRKEKLGVTFEICRTRMYFGPNPGVYLPTL